MTGNDIENFAQFENSDDQGAPIELYEFSFGDTNDSFYRYTTSIVDLKRDPTRRSSKDTPYVPAEGDPVWKAVPISRDEIEQTSKAERTGLVIHLPVDTDLAMLYGDYPPATVCTCKIYSGHLTDPYLQFHVIWAGRVLSTVKNENEIDVSCDSLLVSLKRPGIKRNFQYACPLVLYGKYCRANKKPFPVEVVEVINGKSLLIKSDWNQGVDFAKFTNGTLVWQGDYGLETRTLGTVSDKQLQIRGSLRYIKAGTKCNIYLGCNHLMSDCENLHNNVVNFGGQPWIPLKNPAKYHHYW